jgi:ankyrin repeat protein
MLAHQGDLASVELLLNHGADAELVDANGRTPLHRASRNGHVDCVGYLLDNGADIAIDRGDHQVLPACFSFVVSSFFFAALLSRATLLSTIPV